jgi:catechol 2,3-dioxygenase-like lactoylglutathione lyase family enzyme
MSVKSLAHVCLKTRDLEATTAFYCDALGMEKLFNFRRNGEVIGFYLKTANESFIEVFLTNGLQPPQRDRALDHFCLQTEAIEDVRKKLRAKGYSPGEIKMGADHSLQFWITEPNGLAIEFHQYTDKSTQFTGADVEVDW